MRRLSFLLLAAIALLSACGGDSTPTGITVNFVGNSTCDTNGQTPYSPSPPNTNAAPVGQPIAEMPHYHVVQGTAVTYLHNPPTSGCHYSLGVGLAPISPGVYPPSALPKLTAEYWLHNLEHGYVVVTYNCPSGCDADMQTLNTWYHQLPPDPAGNVAYAKVIVVPYAAQKEKWDVVSWDWFDPIGSTLNMTEIQKFYANHVNQAPELGQP